MKIIDRYVLSTQLATVLLVLLVLLGLAGFISFLEEADSAGSGNFAMLDVVQYVLMKLPGVAVDMFPAATLIGSLLGLGALASRSELIAMQAAGVSIGRLAISVSIVGLFLMLLAGFIGEWIAAPAENYAKQERSRKLQRDMLVAGEQGVWFRDGNRIINIANWRDPSALNGVTEFILNPQSEISAIKQASKGGYTQDSWLLESVQTTRFLSPSEHSRGEDTAVLETGAESSSEARSELQAPPQLQSKTEAPLDTQIQIETHEQPSVQWDVNLEPQTLDLFSVEPNALNIQELNEYVGFLNKNQLDTQRYEVAFWSRIANIVSIFFMSLLALPFVFGSLRKGNAGLRLFFGVGIGIAYISANRLLAGTGEVYGLNPFLSATIPTMALMVFTLIAIVRAR